MEENADEQNKILIDFIENARLLFDKIINTIDNYLNSHIMIQKTIIRRFKAKQFNYQLLKNLKNKTLFENDLFKEMKLLNDQLDIKEEIEKKFKEPNFIDKQVNLIFNQIYTPINEAIQAGEKKENEKTYAHGNKATILYEIPGKQFDRRVKLFDPVFVENNKDNISMVISCLEGENKKVIYKGPLISEYWNNRDANKIQVDLIEDKHGVTDMSYMLNNCKYAKDVNFSGWKMINIISVEAMFQLCNFDKIDQWKTSFSNILKEYEEPDIIERDEITEILRSINHMFRKPPYTVVQHLRIIPTTSLTRILKLMYSMSSDIIEHPRGAKEEKEQREKNMAIVPLHTKYWWE